MLSPRRILLSLVLSAIWVGAMMLTLFWPAGRWDIPVFWVYIGGFAIIWLVGLVALEPALIKERVRPGPGGRDYLLIHLGKTLFTGHLVLAGFDVGRYHWSDGVPPGVQVPALVLAMAGMALAMWAMGVNRFFSSVIRLQTDRGHHVVRGGPYRVVRHPGYAGVLVTALTSAPALGSWVSAIPLAGFIVLLLRRTLLEDRFLKEKLDGYAEYSREVRWRLVPGGW